MLTRRQVHRMLVWVGLGLGALGAVIYMVTPIVTIRYEGPVYTFQVGRGAVALFWRSQPTMRTVVVPVRPGGQQAPIILPDQGPLVLPAQPAGQAGGGAVGRVQVTQPLTLAAPIDGAWNVQGRRLPLYLKPDLQDVGPGSNNGRAVLPAWILIVVGAVCVYLLLPSEVAPGHCQRCRFDIRCTPEVAGRPGRIRCPECGHLNAAVRAPDVPEGTGRDQARAAADEQGRATGS